MKQILLRAMFLASILVFAASCNDDDDDNDNPTPQPTATLNGTTINPQNGNESSWSASSISAEYDLTRLLIKAVNGNDTLSIAIPSPEESIYPIDLLSPLSSSNYYVSVTSIDTTVYTFRNAIEGGGVVTITESDSANQRISGELTLIYYNPNDTNDFFLLSEGQFANINYSLPDFNIGGEGTMTATVNGDAIDFETITAFNFGGILSLTGSNTASSSSISLSFSSGITAGTYSFSLASGNSANFIDADNGLFTATSGTLVISSNNGENVTGTFSFDAINSVTSENIEVTNGSFTIDY